MEAEMEAEKAEVSLQIYEEEEMGEERKDIELVVDDWQPPKSQSMEEQREKHKNLPFPQYTGYTDALSFALCSKSEIEV
ncbi:hypothetical protein AWC38_SpisGene13900 [Stylophora pistillata]|uniref:Uncharacterized protein n=1 Tax=Stylophora pistillata TaxID=50429 RepID=A0A2B4RZD3_STYPI|nr:hypothetical protein AWC38_SpisGene13900 [Stylophora pistillata]